MTPVHYARGGISLQFAILTGCLRIARESIFTGLNNFNVLSITDVRFDEYFGFSDREVKAMLQHYSLEEHYEQIKEWHDGYRFRKADVYCPWDVINYVNLLRSEPDAVPKAFWMNTSGNYIIRRFLQMATPKTRREIESLLAVESVKKKVNQELTYGELYKNLDNFWSMLFITGYLTYRGKEEAKKNGQVLDEFCRAFAAGDGETVERLFTAYLKKTISIRDTSVRKEKKRTFITVSC